MDHNAQYLRMYSTYFFRIEKEVGVGWLSWRKKDGRMLLIHILLELLYILYWTYPLSGRKTKLLQPEFELHSSSQLLEENPVSSVLPFDKRMSGVPPTVVS